MLDFRSKRASSWRGAALLGVVALITAIADTPAAWAFTGARHKRITRDALPFVRGSVLDIIVAGNLDEDQGDAEDLAERHGQNCRFSDSAAYVNMRYRQVVEALRQPQANDPNRAARLFGHILHGQQDFYSHANWIPTPPQGIGIRGRLLDSGLGLWPLPTPYSTLFDDVVVIEGDPPQGVTVRLPAVNGQVAGAVPIVEDRRVFPSGRQFRGLMTSGAPRHPGDQQCPPVSDNCDIDRPDNVCLRHGDLRDSDTSRRTFDGKGSMNLDGGGGGDWFEARRYARLQTRHEWCRLLHLSRDLDPTFVAAGRLLGTWVRTDAWWLVPNPVRDTPHIPGTPCAGGAERRHLVEITATIGSDAPTNVPFVVFRSDFTSSARTTAGRMTRKTLRICGNTNETIVATLIPTRTPGTTFRMWVPGTARTWTERGSGAFDVMFTVRVVPNSC
jgi:hypothetical protein